MTLELVADAPESLLLAAKFAVPEAPPFMVARPALVERVADGVRHPVTLITGPAGSGKTQLAASWATGRPAVWISLEGGDDLFTYVLEGLRRSAPASFPALGPLVPAAPVDRSVLSRVAAYLAGRGEPVVLVLDGVSQLTDGQWAADLEFLVRHAGGQLRLVLVGRWDPPLPLYRYRLAGQLSEVRSADLAFTADEAAHLLGLHDVRLSDQGRASLLEHTEGWAAGLRLCASALQGRDDAEDLVATISGDETTIAEYFVGEVLRMEPPEVRRFLLETSVLGIFPPDLADAVTGRSDARWTLATLARKNAFVQVVPGTGSYRYHRLFAELLRAQLGWERPAEVPRLHRRAAEWLAAEGQIVDAVGHAVAAGDWAGAAEIVVDDYAVGRVVVEADRCRLGAMLRDLPEMPDRPEVTVVRAALALAGGSHEPAAALVAGPGSDALTLSTLLLRVLAGADGPDPVSVLEAIADAETYLAAAPAERIARHPELPALLLQAKGTAQNWAGDLDAAAITLGAAITAAGPGCERARIYGLWQLALTEAYRGRLIRAETLARQALDLAARCGLQRDERPAGAEVALAWVAVERFDVEAADHHLRAAHAGIKAAQGGFAAGAYAIVKARRLQARGELRGALRVLNEAPAPAPVWVAREIRLAQARMMIAADRLSEAGALLAAMDEPATADVTVVRAGLALAVGEPRLAHDLARTVADAAGVTSPVAVDAWLLLAMIAARGDDVDGAREALRRALRVAGPEAQRRPVHQVWTGLRRVIRDDDDLAVQYRSLGGPAAREASGSAEPVVVESLSRRELEVLRGMAAMLPTEEIAASMFVSVNTVKTHVRSILRKLAASRRNEAVRRARALRLI
ncbi:MAG: LuxR C-terminal-related transcriptional regulator [Actinoplanes sp.]